MSATWPVRPRLARPGLALLTVFGFILAACGGDDGGQAEESSAVTIKSFVSSLKVKAGPG